MLKKLVIHRFRHVKPGVTLTFNDGFNVLLGRNGTGKTTLLDIISLVVRGDFSGLRDEEFDLEFDLEYTVGSATIEIRNKPQTRATIGSVWHEVDGQSGPPRESRPYLHARLRGPLTGPASEIELEVEQSALRWRIDDASWSNGAVVDLFGKALFRELYVKVLGLVGHEVPSGHRVLLAAHQHARSAYRFDESLDTYDAITGSARREPDGLARAPEVSAAVNFDPAHTTPKRSPVLRSVFMPLVHEIREPERGQSSAMVVLQRERLGEFPSIAGLGEMSVSVAVERSSRDDEGVWWHFGRLEFQFSEAGGATFRHNALSYGQKRLLAFLYYLDANDHYVIADELVNGMHHEWIRYCLDALDAKPSRLQSFLTSQNPLLLDYIPIGTVGEAQRTFIQCRSEVVDGRACFLWSNLTDDEAADLFADHKVGIQHLGELLRVKGLW